MEAEAEEKRSGEIRQVGAKICDIPRAQKMSFPRNYWIWKWKMTFNQLRLLLRRKMGNEERNAMERESDCPTAQVPIRAVKAGKGRHVLH